MTSPEAHPRSRGENPSSSRYRKTVRGSSPLTRGKQEGPGPTRGRGRLIPAHAGKTLLLCVGPRALWAHPRSRGENHENVGLDKTVGGSSPLTRGKRLNRGLPELVHGLIPAHAGKTTRREAEPCCLGAHPRSRGENLTGRQGLGKSWGSSPLTRGKLLHPRRRYGREGLIPAHAGKTART